MNCEKEISYQIEKIKTIFQEAKKICTEQNDFSLVINYLENLEPEFSSIGYEAVSMTLALKDFSKDDSLMLWRQFMEGKGANHKAQVHVGLGWAIAQQKRLALPILETINPLMHFRVLDGYGYYDGVFKHDQTVKIKIRLKNFQTQFLWHTTKAWEEVFGIFAKDIPKK